MADQSGRVGGLQLDEGLNVKWGARPFMTV